MNGFISYPLLPEVEPDSFHNTSIGFILMVWVIDKLSTFPQHL